jgi:hypothetical protein
MTVRRHDELTLQEWLADYENDFIVDQELTHPHPEFEDMRQRVAHRLGLEHPVGVSRNHDGK